MSRRGLVSLTTRRQVRRSGGDLARAATQRLEATYDWYAQLGAEERSWVGLVAQAGMANFIDWLDGKAPADTRTTFGAAPRELTSTISLAQTLELARSVVDVVEERVDELARPGDVTALHIAVLRYSREVAFGAAQIYAHAAEQRGAWDARLESLVIDAVMRGEVDESIRTRAAALGWGEVTNVVVLVGGSPLSRDDEDPAGAVGRVHSTARRLNLPILAGVQGARLVAVVGEVDDPAATAKQFAPCFAEEDLVHGPRVASLADGALSAHAAVAGHVGPPGHAQSPRKTCSPSGPSPATTWRGPPSWSRSNCPWRSTPACSRPRAPTWSPRDWRPPPARSSCTCVLAFASRTDKTRRTNRLAEQAEGSPVGGRSSFSSRRPACRCVGDSLVR